MPPPDLFRASTHEQWSLGTEHRLVCRNGESAPAVLPALDASLLRWCNTFRTLDGHLDAIATASALPPGGREDARQRLLALAARGFLVARDTLVRRLSEASSLPPPPPLRWLGIPTRHRPAELERCITSYAASASAHGRPLGILVMDDSSDPALHASVLARLQALPKEVRAHVFYAGRAEKQRFAQKLLQQGLPPEPISTALFNERGLPNAYGINRNGLLLATAGETFFSVDDDTQCRLAPAEGGRDTLALAAGELPQEFRWYRDRAATLAEAGLAELDPFAPLDRLLGRDASGCLASHAWTRVDVDRAEGSFLGRLMAGQGHVRVVMHGCAGASSAAAPRVLRILAMLDLHADDALTRYRNAFSREELRRSPCYLVTDAHLMASGMMALDNRGLLPPFIPLGQREDACFADLLARTHPDTLFGHVPYALFHAPEGRGPFSWDDILKDVRAMHFGDLIGALLGEIPHSHARSESARMEAAGRALVEISTWEDVPFLTCIRRRQWTRECSYLERYLAALEQTGPLGEPWSSELRRYLDLYREALAREDYGIAAEAQTGPDSTHRAALTRQRVREFGELLIAWPQLWEAARQLRAQGETMELPLSSRV